MQVRLGRGVSLSGGRRENLESHFIVIFFSLVPYDKLVRRSWDVLPLVPGKKGGLELEGETNYNIPYIENGSMFLVWKYVCFILPLQ